MVMSVFVAYRAGRKEKEGSQNVDGVCMCGGQSRIYQIGEKIHELVVVVTRGGDVEEV